MPQVIDMIFSYDNNQNCNDDANHPSEMPSKFDFTSIDLNVFESTKGNYKEMMYYLKVMRDDQSHVLDYMATRQVLACGKDINAINIG